MSEADTIDFNNPAPCTITSLTAELRAARLQAGDIVLVHTSLSKIGWVAGGPVAVVEALMRVLTPQGTLMMPTHTGDNSDPAFWVNPPVPEAWWQAIRDESPAYDPATTPTRGMGAVVEAFRKYPGVIRSEHPVVSFAAWGKHAAELTVNHALTADLGEGSPLSRLYDRDGYVMLIGVDHGNNTSLHLAEYRADFPWARRDVQGCVMKVDGERRWVEYPRLEISDHDFATLGADYERTIRYAPAKLGSADLRLLRQRPLVDYAVRWLRANRTPPQIPPDDLPDNG
ncbi:MAG: AAC(3) family N-acetyltransferase [Anaerolineae bacterium]|nr:AAC(3) family N-acetyltransferase [Anaerolineae bacterium]